MARRLGAAAAIIFTLTLSSPALADDGGDGRAEARVAGSCSSGASSELRLRSRDGAIRVEFVLKPRRAGGIWRTILVHERRVEWRGNVRSSRSSRSVRLRRSVGDFAGPDQITVRASSSDGVTCTASTTLSG